MARDADDVRPNLLVICVDCLREDHLTGSAADTPFLDELRRRGLAATELFATTSTTTPCVASILTGTYSERNGVQSLDVGRLSPDVEPFAERFGAAGYHTEALVTGPLVEETGLHRGFDTYRHRPPEASLFGEWFGTVRERLAELPEPFAAFLHLWELHEDVYVPAAFDDPEYGATPYARALSALDRRLEEVVAAVPDTTLVCVHGDHGESITCRSSVLRLGLKSLRDALRYYGGVDTRRAVRRLNRALANRGADIPDHYVENGHGENVFDFVTNVPFLLAGPGIDRATVDAQTRQVDVLPTLLDACDVEAGPTDFHGRSLLPPEAVTDRPAYMRACGASLHRRKNWARAVRANGAKYVEYPERDWPPELYELDYAPLELTPVEDADLARTLRTHFPYADLDGGERLDVEERLEQLGYR